METASIGKPAHRDGAHPPARAALSLGAPHLFAIFAAEAVAIDIARRPVDMSFDHFAFFDYGANFTLQYLISAGYRPAIDFGYHYGLLAALIGRVWFGCMGATASAYQWAMVTGAILFAWALARIFAGRRIGGPGIALLIVSFGLAFQSSYPNLAHCIEAVILAHALAAQARGSYRNALALATTAVFVKPSMGYIFGAVLLVLMALEIRRNRGGMRDFIAAAFPSAVIFGAASVVLIGVYGARSFLFTIVPIEGVSLYRAVNFGLASSGRYLWDPLARPIPMFFIDISGFWIASTAYLIVAAILQAWSWMRGEELSRAGEVIITSAVLHLSFMVFFFGGGASWIYYSYLLAIGCALATEMGRGWRLVAVPLSVLALLSWTSTASFIYRQWKTRSPNAQTAGLWSIPGQASEWNKVLAMAHREKMVVLDTKGAVELMYPEFGKPVSMFLDPGLETQEDVARKAAQLKAAEAFVVPATVRKFGGLPDAPELAAATADFALEWKGDFFEVYRRRAASAGTANQE
jgi:MFS family permease